MRFLTEEQFEQIVREEKNQISKVYRVANKRFLPSSL